MILNIIELKKKIKNLKKKKYKIGLCHGVFDVLHSGHILYFNEAKKKCDILIVSLTEDKFVNKGPDRPFMGEHERLKILSILKNIDFLFLNNASTPIKLINEIKPNFYFKGFDFINMKKDITKNIIREKNAIKSVNGEFVIIKTKLLSSSKIINQQKDDQFLDKFLKKIDFEKTKKVLRGVIENKIESKITILGETIIDRFSDVEPLGRSLKSNTTTNNYLVSKDYGGGTILVANLMSKFIKDVNLVIYQNRKVFGNFKNLISKKVKLIKIYNIDYKPLIKNRFIDNYNKKVLSQINYNNYLSNNNKTEKKLIKFIKSKMKSKNHLICLDYGHGMITPKLLKYLNTLNGKISINCQTNSSNFGFNLATKYKKGDIMCIDTQEFRLCVQDKYSDLRYLLNKNKSFIKKFKKFIVTTGKYGCYVVSNDKVYNYPYIGYVPIDTTGCGDVFFSLFSIFKMCKNLTIDEITLLSHIGAGIHSTKFGNDLSVNPIKIYQALETLSKR